MKKVGKRVRQNVMETIMVTTVMIKNDDGGGDSERDNDIVIDKNKKIVMND